MYSKFYQAIYDLPLPDGLNEQQKMQYRMFLDRKAAPVQEKAVKAFRTAWQLALQLKAYNKWSRRSAKRISELESQSFPITGQKGVESGHGQIRFYVPEALTDFDVAVERAEKRKPEEPEEPEGEEAPKEKEGEPDEGEGEGAQARAGDE